MPANSVMPPIELFTDTAGNPLDAGFIYIGEPGFDARTTPKAAFFDAALTIACPPAIRTSAGYPVRNGAAATIYVDGNHSMTVTDRNGVVVFSNLSRAFELGTPTTTLAQIVAPDGTLLQTGFGFASDTDTGLIRSAANTIQVVAGGVPAMTITGTGVTMPAIPANSAWGNFTGASASPAATNAATVRASMGVPAIPTGTSSVPGQIVLISPAFGTAYTLPAGGTWLVSFVQFTNAGAYAFQTGLSILAGGSTLAAPPATQAYVGWAWRIA